MDESVLSEPSSLVISCTQTHRNTHLGVEVGVRVEGGWSSSTSSGRDDGVVLMRQGKGTSTCRMDLNLPHQHDAVALHLHLPLPRHASGLGLGLGRLLANVRMTIGQPKSQSDK